MLESLEIREQTLTGRKIIDVKISLQNTDQIRQYSRTNTHANVPSFTRKLIVNSVINEAMR